MAAHQTLASFIRMVDSSATATLTGKAKHDDVYKDITACFGSSDSSSRNIVAELQSELVARNVAFNEPLLPYYSIASVLHDSLRSGGSSDGYQSDWAKAVQIIAENKEQLALMSLDEAYARRMSPKAVANGVIAKKLIDMGYQITLTADTSVVLSDASLEKLKIDIDESVWKVGGRELMSSVLHNIAPTFNTTTHRLHLVRSVSMAASPPEPQVPWAYLYQLAVKHFQQPSREPGETAFNHLIQLVTLAVAVLGVQPYSGFHSFFLKPGSVMGFLRESVVYDSLFTLPQVPFPSARAIYTKLVAESRFASLQFQGAPITVILEIADEFLRCCKFDRPLKFTADEMARKLKKSRKNVVNILDSVFTHDMSQVNTLLSFPPKSTEVDSGFRPLLKFDQKHYWCPPQPIAASAALEAILFAVRATDKKADGEFGMLIEELLREQFLQKGIQYKHGDYDFGKVNGKEIHGECDIVIETDSTIILFELKKKPLTRIARSGDDIEILVDISKSLIDSQLQAMGHEQLLRLHPRITLIGEDGATSEVELNGREVIRVTVVFLDYGSIQDRSTFQQFMRISCGVEFRAIDAALQPKLDKLLPRFEELKEVGANLGEFSKTVPFETSYFLSIPQLLLLLEFSTDTETFVKELLRTRRVMTPIKDFYAEYAHFRDVLDSPA